MPLNPFEIPQELVEDPPPMNNTVTLIFQNTDGTRGFHHVVNDFSGGTAAIHSDRVGVVDRHPEISISRSVDLPRLKIKRIDGCWNTPAKWPGVPHEWDSLTIDLSRTALGRERVIGTDPPLNASPHHLVQGAKVWVAHQVGRTYIPFDDPWGFPQKVRAIELTDLQELSTQVGQTKTYTFAGENLRVKVPVWRDRDGIEFQPRFSDKSFGSITGKAWSFLRDDKEFNLITPHTRFIVDGSPWIPGREHLATQVYYLHRAQLREQ